MEKDTPSTEKPYKITATFRTQREQQKSPSSPTSSSSQPITTRKKSRRTKETKYDRLLDAFATREAARFSPGSKLEKVPVTPLRAPHEFIADTTLQVAPHLVSDLAPGEKEFILKKTPRPSTSPQLKDNLKQLLDWSAKKSPGRSSLGLAPEEKKQRQREQNKAAQQKFSSREYRIQLQATYQNGKELLRTKGKLTPKHLRDLKNTIIAKETSLQTGVIKRQEIQAFDRWVKADIAQYTALRNNSR